MTNATQPFGLFASDTEGLDMINLKVLDVNVHGTIFGVKIFLHHVQKLNPGPAGDGKAKARVVITSSQGGFYALPDPVYTASKHAVRPRLWQC